MPKTNYYYVLKGYMHVSEEIVHTCYVVKASFFVEMGELKDAKRFTNKKDAELMNRQLGNGYEVVKVMKEGA